MELKNDLYEQVINRLIEDNVNKLSSFIGSPFLQIAIEKYKGKTYKVCSCICEFK